MFQELVEFFEDVVKDLTQLTEEEIEQMLKDLYEMENNNE